MWRGLGEGLIRILHVITDLDRGGAEYSLKRLVGCMDPRRYSSRVVTLLPPGPVGEELKTEGIPVASLDCATFADAPRALWRLMRLIRRSRPDIIQTWLYHADVLGTLAGFAAPRCRLFWNVRNSALDEGRRRDWQLLTAFLALTSRLPEGIVSNSVAGIEAHARRGYRARRWIHIPNGWIVADRAPTAEQRRRQRQVFGLPADDVLIGFVARLAKQKDFGCFVAAVAALGHRCPRLKFVLTGRDVTQATPEFKVALGRIGLPDRLIFLGEQPDVAALIPALDAVTLTSAYGEGLPNSIGEAMAAGLPVITTDVGDIRRLLAEGNWLVPPKSPEALAAAWIALAELEPQTRAALGERNRVWIEARYPIERMRTLYERLYAGVMQPQPDAAPDELDLQPGVGSYGRLLQNTDL